MNERERERGREGKEGRDQLIALVEQVVEGGEKKRINCE
jgi:hypothetical protein